MENQNKNNQSAPCSTPNGRPGFHVDPRFTNLRPLGHGGNALVYSATDSDCDKEVAIKKLSFCDRRGCKYALRELRLMRRLQHENVVTVYEVLGSNGFSLESGGTVSANSNEVSNLYIVQELLHTDLHQLIQQQQLNEEHVRLFTYQLLRGLKYIHSANVMHRDLKPMNLLVNVEDLVLKIADFGLARVMDGEYSHKGFLTDNVGTCWYRSPELIISPRDYTKTIDMWSVGCILAEMLTGRPLFPGAHEMDQIGLILDTIYLSDNEWNTVTQILPASFRRRHTRTPTKPLHQLITSVDIDALDLLEKLLVFESSLRVSAEEALTHPYLQQYSCVQDEPIVLTPFHIEHEVDDLSPKTARRLISAEMSRTIDVCGSQIQAETTRVNADQTHATENIGRSTPSIEVSQENTRITSPNATSPQENSMAGRDCDKNRSTDRTDNNVNKSVEDKNTKNGTSVFIEDYFTDRNVNVHNGRRCSNDEAVGQSGARLSGQTEHTSAFRPFSGNTRDNSVNQTSRSVDQTLPLEAQMKNLTVIVDWTDEENLKEQISPKENKDEGTEKSKLSKERENANLDRLVVTVDSVQPKTTKDAVPKANDIVNQGRQVDSPRSGDFDEIDFIRLEKERMRQLGLIEKFKNNQKKKKKNRRNNRGNGTDDGQDFDTLYRLPTEHLTRHRHNSICAGGKDRNVRKVEDQLRLHEELNERRRMVEMERELNYGAVGGHPELDEVVADRSTHFEMGNASPSSEHSRDSSPSNEDNTLRRFER